uniref:UPF0517 membrane protein CG10671 n=1 Tax=Caligus rogercresseyi TaxID=217165 RepID=C1BNF2_CALRO|nr:UPF0517 membrane protein CG10671 [Caligus rogercresseyi]
MGPKKPKSSFSRSMKFRPPSEVSKKEFKGTKPLAERATIGHIIFLMWIQFCRKIMYAVPTSSKVGLYIIGTLILSILSEFSSASDTKTYLSNPHNVFNLYGVKYGWAWTLLGTVPFIVSSSFILRKNSLQLGLIRLALATGIWYTSTLIFQRIESSTGICNSPQYYSKSSCRRAGFYWSGFDVSGHSFLLIWNNLFILEEARAYIGWEKIKEMLRHEDYRRVSADNPSESKELPNASMSKLSIDAFVLLRKNYFKMTPLIRIFFCFLAAQVLLWDVMLVCTALYFHIMIEKVLGALTAVVCWFFLYRFAYEKADMLPGQCGSFKYMTVESTKQNPSKADRRKLDRSSSWSEADSVPKFMGMPIYNYKGRKQTGSRNNEVSLVNNVNPGESEFDALTRRSSMDLSGQRPLRSSMRSRSISKSRLSGSSFSSLNMKYSH